ncbi:DNA-binding domain-containing protein [Pokkaliibacter sp. MBI-7]|uniref:DNA-binding domain-containing protein n=1 Tax=Pokkaliibacter sp. MBI-7 TaxID=3040600 RepID=UPI002447B1C9|nr:DNA-binding domain-containing protein [Pokkaliibacter sp. MBI-7]MDH2432689.1 DNA-binding domain-containing protein [Pokkaliibacter sp. MBI-7]
MTCSSNTAPRPAVSALYSLQAQQQWLLQRVLLGPAANIGVAERLRGSAQLSAEQRLAIYQDGYRLRLLECMQAEFPALQLYLGEALFRLFVIGYLERQPSRHYSLYQLGAGLADFLAATRPAGAALPADTAALLRLPEQLARLERAQAEALRAPGCEHLPAASLSERGWLSWPALALPATSQLVQTEFGLLAYLQQADHYMLARQRGEEAILPLPPSAEPQSLLVYRHQYRINVVRLEPWQAALIRQLQQGTGCDWAQLAAVLALPESELLTRLSLWLPQATAQSMVLQHQL